MEAGEDKGARSGGMAFAGQGDTHEDAGGDSIDFADMVAQIDAAEALVAEADRVLRERKEELRVLVQEALVAKMRAANIDRGRTLDGVELILDESTYASVPKTASKDDVVAFLDGNGEGAIVERAFVIGVGKDSAAIIDSIEEKIREIPAGDELDTKVDVRIPPSALSAMARRWLAAGRTVPGDLIRVYTETKVKIKRPKAT